MRNVEADIVAEETALEDKVKDFPTVGFKRSPILCKFIL